MEDRIITDLGDVNSSAELSSSCCNFVIGNMSTFGLVPFINT